MSDITGLPRAALGAALAKYLAEPLNDGSGKSRLEALAEAMVDRAFESKDFSLFKEIVTLIEGKGKKDDMPAAPNGVMELIEAAITRAAASFNARPVIDVLPTATNEKAQLAIAGPFRDTDDD